MIGYDKQLGFIVSLLEGKRELNNQEINTRCQSLGIDQLHQPFQVVTIAPDYSSVEHETKDSTIENVQAFCEKELSRSGLSFYLITNSYNNVQILISKAQKASQLDELMKQLREKLLVTLFLDSFIGIGSIVSEPSKIFQSAYESQKMLAYKYQYAEQGVVNVENFMEFNYNSMFGSDIVFERVIGCFIDGNIEKMSVRLDELVDHVRKRPNVSKSSIRRTLIELAIRIVNIASNANIDVDAVIGDRDIYHWIMNQGHTEVISEWILDISSQFISIIKEMNSDDSNRAVSKACIFIDRNLSSNELCLNSIADHVGLTPTYLSQLFKKEKGIGINAFIVNHRIERAKVLLEKSDLSIETVALQVGYSRVQYFTRSFKKNVGESPSQYRANHKKV